MIVEFSGSPASGKTAIASKLYDKAYYPFRVSSKSQLQRVITLFFILSLRTNNAFITNIFQLRKRIPNLSIKRILMLSMQGAMTYTLAKRNDIYIKDQGFFQFGDWVHQDKVTDVDYLSNVLSSIRAEPNAVVFFNLPPELSATRMKKRGDYEKWYNRAMLRGFNSVEERLAHQNSMLSVKYALCDNLRIPYIIFTVDSDSRISKISRYNEQGDANFTAKDFDMLEEEIVKAWKS